MQIEDFFMYLLASFFSGSVIHYLVAKLASPVIFNRGWYGWSCLTAMILDLLPFKRNKSGRLARKWEFLRYVHFALSLGLVLVLWYGFDYRVHSPIFAPMVWLLIGNLLYYIIGIALAYRLKDNRAFCKYICPVPVLQKFPADLRCLKWKGQLKNVLGVVHATKCARWTFKFLNTRSHTSACFQQSAFFATNVWMFAQRMPSRSRLGLILEIENC